MLSNDTQVFLDWTQQNPFAHAEIREAVRAAIEANKGGYAYEAAVRAVENYGRTRLVENACELKARLLEGCANSINWLEIANTYIELELPF